MNARVKMGGMLVADGVNTDGAGAMGLGARIADLRRQRGESLQQVADAVGVSKAHIWDLEKGRTGNPSLALLKGIAEHFDVSVASLVGEDPQAGDADPAAAALFRQAKDLHADDLAIVRDMMKVLLARRRGHSSGG